MTRLRTLTAVGAAFVVSQVLAVAVHGAVLAADYAPYEGTLLRSEAAWPMLFLPVAHLSFISALTWVTARLRLDGPQLARGVTIGLVGWAMGQAPLWLIWYAQQPWPGYLVVKQLGLELGSSIVVGITIATVLGSPATRRHDLDARDEPLT